ncbi:putative AbiEi antitoxin of type IV toxin-antitoxin system [Georgenia soli]|uniref:Putative AbiEi antitoxin of type IV toxin-antitoxin system n=1 Tax=Georgenia soli TaxID=638953 RepID=A0A2A9EIF0_9MICO|nr:type IV toxin-antitoxin system AbiEi family antitoxin domain-containing protein [Georgenia soli]PFG38857.1 putative AbiEi antitoxin of type IV toxin-antitoxin system [Georgenia soli]
MEPTHSSGLVLSADLTAQGLGPGEIRRAVRDNDLTRVRRGAYVPATAWNSARPESRYRYLVHATVAATRTPVVLSHESAAVLHGFPRIGSWPTVVHAVRERTTGGRSSTTVIRHGVPRMPEVVTVDGLHTTSVARTVIDLARTSSFLNGVVAADHVLANGLATREELEVSLLDVRRMHGHRRAERVLRFADGRAQSVGESLSRVRMHELRLPVPDLQVEFRDAAGFVARVDFWWERFRLVGEFDGRGKYVPGDADPRLDTSEIVYREKLREDRLRRLVSAVVRWGWAEVWNRELFAGTMARAGLHSER